MQDLSLYKESNQADKNIYMYYVSFREQRVTSLMVGIFSGLAVLITSVLQVGTVVQICFPT